MTIYKISDYKRPVKLTRSVYEGTPVIIPFPRELIKIDDPINVPILRSPLYNPVSTVNLDEVLGF